jgi:hypothetical protein
MPSDLQRLSAAVKTKYYTAVDAFLTALCWQSLFLGWAFRYAAKPLRRSKGEGPTNNVTEVELLERLCARAA